MTGICGIIYPNPLHTTRMISPMLETLEQRGGKEKGSELYKNLELGCSGQPIAYNSKKTVWLAFDGTITNTDTILAELKKKEHTPQNGKIASLLIEAYETWGTDFVQHIEGSFVIALFDEKKEQLLIIRDRIGKKPLYWYHHQDHFVFASDLKALLTTGLVPQTASLGAMSAYLFFGYFPQDLAPIQKVSKLLPGHHLTIHLDQNKRIRQYWSYSSLFEAEPCCSFEEQVHTLDHLLSSAICRSAESGKDVGCFVSGGLGSASVASYLHEACCPKKLSAFSMGFSGENDQDIASASMTANTLQIKHYVGNVNKEDIFNDLVEIIWHLGEPLADPNIVATWRIAKLAATHSQTVFSGMGTDELLAGHRRYILPEQKLGMFTKCANQIKPALKQFLLPLLTMIYRPAALRFLKHYPTNPWQAEYLSENAILSGPMLKTAAPNLANLFDPEIFLNKFYHIGRIPYDLDATLYLDVKTRLVDLYIRQYECLTSVHNLNWLSPFLDENIVTLLASLPKTRAPEQSSLSLLKNLVSETLPAAVVNRPKKVRHHFLENWLNTPSIRKTFERLENGTLVGNGIISKKWIHTLLHKPPKEVNAFLCLWQILCLEIWFKLFVDNVARRRPPNISLSDLLES